MKANVKVEKSVEANIFFNQPTGVLAFNSRFEIIACNNAFASQAAISAEEIIGESVFGVISFDKETQKNISDWNTHETTTGFARLNGIQIEVTLTPILEDTKIIGRSITLGEEVIGNRRLNHLSKNGFKSVIEKAPVTIMIFRHDGSVFYTNQHYKELWGLNERELLLIHEYYNVFEDVQLNNQAIGPYVKKAFEGNSVELPVIHYKLNFSGLGRGDNYPPKENWLMGYFFPMQHPDNQENLTALIFADVTRQIDAEIAFKKSQERLEMALEGGELGTWDWDVINDKIVYNRQWAKMLGYELDEMNVLLWEHIVHPDDKDWVKQELLNHMEGLIDSYEAEYRIKSKQGEWRWVLDRGKVVEYTSKGKPKRVSGTHLDITNQKLSAEVIKASEERYRSLANNLPTGIVIVQDGVVVYTNQNLLTLMAAESEDQLIGKNAADCFVNGEAYLKRDKRIIERGMPEPTIEMQVIDLNGKEKSVEITSIPFKYNGKPAVQSIIHDIEERKEIERQTLKAEKLLSQLFENAPMGIVMLGFDDEILKVNKGFERMFGYQESNVIGKYINDVIVPIELIEEGKKLSKDSGDGKMVYCETNRINSKNETVPVLIYTLPVMHEGQRLGVYGIYIDISKRLKVEEELKVRNLELDNFVYKVSHDLRSPLASILGLINLVKLEGKIDHSVEYLDLMEDQVHKLDHFIHDVLSHSKNLKMSLITTNINFDEIVDKCLSDLSYLEGFENVEKNISITCKGFMSDKWRINEIFRNLIANTIKYQDRSKSKSKLNVSINADEKECSITISDNGIGIQEESLPHIFEMFYRATDSSKGSGIGLYIVKNAVEKLNGYIEIDSEYGKGTTFSIWIPSLKE